jgi:hypothetical protein
MRQSPSPVVTPSAQITVFNDIVEFRRVVPVLKYSRQGRGIDYPKRGKVTDFTARSRNRLIRKLAKARKTRHGYFITLTYPDIFPLTPGDWKDHLHTFTVYLQRRFPGSSGLWRMEFKVRKSGEVHEGFIAPHFHLLCFGVAIPQEAEWRLKQWCSETWYKIVNSGDHRHIKAGTNVRPILNKKHAYRYVSKYAAKLHNEEFSIVANVGRHWGSFGNLELTASIICQLDKKQALAFRRYCRKHLSARNYPSAHRYSRQLARDPPHMGFSILGIGDNISIGSSNRQIQAILSVLQGVISEGKLLGLVLNDLQLTL